MDDIEARKLALAYGSLTAIVAWRAIEIDGESRAPGALARMQAALDSGEASFGVYIQRNGDELYISASPIPPGPQDPFAPGNRLSITGPMVISREQLAALVAANPLDRTKFN